MVTNALPSSSGELYFGVDARHVRQLGQQLVGDRVTALTELVKNAYDADATRVILNFSSDTEVNGGRLVVSDDGAGMSLDDVRDAWMRIAGDGKERSPRSRRFNRVRAGRKGIGRFAAESLGGRLVLWTTRAGEPTAVRVEFNWDEDYDSGQDIQSVANRYSIVDAPVDATGTRLTIERLHSVWTLAQRKRVARALLLLQPPFPIRKVEGADADPGFRVDLIVNGKTEPQLSMDAFLQGETAHLYAQLDDAGELVLRVTSQRLEIDRREVLGTGYDLVGPFEMSAAYFVFSAGAIGVPVAEARELGNEFGGVRVYRDGLRLLPYGEQNNDWLGLDERSRRRQYLNPIGNQNFFAQVSISRERNLLLEDTSSREGLLQNPAYDQLVEAISEALITASLWVAAARNRVGRGTERPRPPRRSRTDLVAQLFETVSNALGEALAPEEASTAIKVVAAAMETERHPAEAADAQEQRDFTALQSEVELLRVLASLGTSISVFGHEVRTVIARATSLVERGTHPDLPETALVSLRGAAEALESLADLATYIDAFTGGARNRGLAPVAVFDLVERFVEDYARPLARSAEVLWEVSPPSLRTLPIGITTLKAILINLLTNSIKAIDQEGVVERRILFSAKSSDDGRSVLLDVSDTGVGVPEDIAEQIFEPFVTSTRAGDTTLGVGTGLGLKIVRDLAVEYGGFARIVEPPAGYATTVQIQLPRWERQIDS